MNTAAAMIPTQFERKKAVLCMAICATMWSMGGIFIKMIPWNALAIAGMRSAIAAIVIYAYIRKKKIKLRFVKPAFFSGFFMSGIYISFVIANKLTTAANAIVLQFTSPVFILILSAVFLHRKSRKGDLITVAVTLIGISLFFFDQLTPGGILGNFFGMLAGLMVACAFLVVGEVDEETRMTGILFGQLFTAIVGVPTLFITHAQITTPAVLSILALGIFQLGIPYVLFGIAMKSCSALACNLIGAIEPLLNPVWVFLFNGEAPGFYALIGALIVVVAITSWCVWNEKVSRKQEQECQNIPLDSTIVEKTI
ncbi:DMT family transporter [Sinanaerobacter sp. ZZT-01]|uniref:DMT family transporter n=1 Tax=Sinanaerobacter sp. ZZT-01 TaxID=3111540 RepID=UPI002D78A290|nr:DMT family transporter [Sinanaerobacter sp. ZZT-01]WRR94395.1 DMT family transporter [Sinanaerobacter sp. ZZT-01]